MINGDKTSEAHFTIPAIPNSKESELALNYQYRSQKPR